MRGRRSGVGGPLPLLSAVQVMGDGLNFPNFPNFWGVRNSGKFASAAAGRGAACPPSRISGDAGVAPTNLPTPDSRLPSAGRDLGGHDQALARIVVRIEFIRSIDLPFHEP